MIVKLVKNQSIEDEYPIKDLSIGSEHEVIGIEADSFRIICEKEKQPYLYPSDCFEIIDNSIPDFWVTKYGEDGEKYSYPSNWNKVGYFEDFFDNVKEVKEKFWKEYRELYKKNS